MLCPPDRFINIPTTDLQEAFRRQFSDDDFRRFTDICKLFEANSRLDFIAVTRRVQDNFRLFSAAARGNHLPMRKGAGLPDDQTLDQTELKFLEDFCNLLTTAHYRLLTEEEWQTATDEEFTFNMPVDVNWDFMDTQLLGRFWSGHPRLRQGTAELLERALVLHRGIHTVYARGLYIEDKIDLLMGYLVVNPLAALVGKVMGHKAKENAKKYSPLTSSNQDTPVADLSRGEGQHTLEAARRAGLEHPNAKVARRITLQRLMPDAAKTFSLLFTKLQIQEPCFTDVVILYRKSKQVLDRANAEKDPLPAYGKAMLQRNLVVKSFCDIPMADMEMIFPEKSVYIKPFILIQLVVTVVLAVFTILSTLVQSKVNLGVLASLASVTAARAYQVWYRAQLTRQQMQDAMTQGLYEKAADSQEGVLNSVLSQMADQHTKEVILAYAVLLLRGEPVTQQGLDTRCELWLDQVFGLKLDFAIENSLPVCLEDGVIERDAQGMLRPLPPAKALDVLKRKWEHHFDKQTSGGAEAKVPGAEQITQECPYDMSITNETQQQQHQPEPERIPATAPAHPTTVTQRRPSQFDQASSNYNGVGSGQFTGAPVVAGQYAGPAAAAGQYSGSGQFSTVSQPAFSSSPRFSSTPVDWGTASTATSTTAAAGTNYRPADNAAQQSVQPRSSNFGIASDSGQSARRVSEESRHPHLAKVLHPFQNKSG